MWALWVNCSMGLQNFLKFYIYFLRISLLYMNVSENFCSVHCVPWPEFFGSATVSKSLYPFIEKKEKKPTCLTSRPLTLTEGFKSDVYMDSYKGGVHIHSYTSHRDDEEIFFAFDINRKKKSNLWKKIHNSDQGEFINGLPHIFL